MKEELAKAKGVPGAWLEHGKWTDKQVEQLTDVHIWTAIAASLQHQERTPLTPPMRPTADSGREDHDKSPTEDKETESTWDWAVPNLREGGP